MVQLSLKIDQQQIQDQLINTTILKIDIDSADLKYEEEGNLSPPMYESDEELRKVALGEHDYLIKIAETRKILLAQLLNKWKGSFNPQVKEEIIEIKTITNEKIEEIPYDSDEEVEKFLSKKSKRNRR